MLRLRKRAERWSWFGASLGGALYALRVSLEAAPQRVPWGAAIALLSIAAGYAAHRRARSASLAPLWFLWVYVAWPRSASTMALGVGFVALSALLFQNLRWERSPALTTARIVDGLTFLSGLALYVSTLAPTILPADSGEFQIVGPLLGVAHPPGYALFTILAKLFSMLPLGDTAWRVNAMGALTGALTLVVVGRTARRLGGSPWAGIAAAGTLGVSTTYWAQSTTVNIRALTVLFTALCCDRLIAFVCAPIRSKQGTDALTGLALSYGLAVAHHAWPILLAPVFVALILWHDPGLAKRVRAWPRLLLAFALPFLSNLYIVVRAITGAPFGTEELVSVGKVIDHLLGRGFGGDMFAFLRLDRVLWERFLVVGDILRFQFGGPLLIIAGAGFAWLAWKGRKPAFLLGGVFAVMAFIVATYRAPQSVEYLMPAYIPVALCVGCAASLVSSHVSPTADRSIARPGSRRAAQVTASLLLGVLYLPIFSLGQAHLPSYIQLHSDRSAREYAESVLLDAPPGAHILSNWHWYTPLRYLQLVENQRTDVEVTYVYPQGATEMPQAWPQRIVHELETSDRPLIVTNYYPTYGDLPYRFVPHGEAFRVQVEPSGEIPADIRRVEADFLEGGEAKIRLLGYRIDTTENVRPGDQLTVDLAWQPLTHLERGYSFFVHVVGDSGVPLGQRDQRHDAAPSYLTGQVLVDRYQFPVYLTAAPGSYQLIAGVYLTFDDGSWQRLAVEDGNNAIALTEISVQPSVRSPVTLHPLNQPFVDGPTLVGVDYDDTVPGQRRVYLHWSVCDRPLLARLYSGEQVVAQGPVPGDERGGYVTTVLDVPSGANDLSIALSQADASAPVPSRAAWGTRHTQPVPLVPPQPYQHYLPFGGKLALIGWSAPGSWVAGEEERVSARFLGLQPIVRDYVISVSVRGDRVLGGPFDGVPALGAVPTFKWVRGSQVTDVHLIQVQPGGGGEAELTLGVYDAFTTAELPALDERIARQGRAYVSLQRIVLP